MEDRSPRSHRRAKKPPGEGSGERTREAAGLRRRKSVVLVRTSVLTSTFARTSTTERSKGAMPCVALVLRIAATHGMGMARRREAPKRRFSFGVKGLGTKTREASRNATTKKGREKEVGCGKGRRMV